MFQPGFRAALLRLRPFRLPDPGAKVDTPLAERSNTKSSETRTVRLRHRLKDSDDLDSAEKCSKENDVTVTPTDTTERVRSSRTCIRKKSSEQTEPNVAVAPAREESKTSNSEKKEEPVSIMEPSRGILKVKRNIRGETPLHVATIKGDLTACKQQLDSGHAVNIKDNAGWTPLHEACHHGHLPVVELLLQYGASPNPAGPENETPLHDAVRSNRLECARLLMAYGASRRSRNTSGLTPDDFARSEEMKHLLETTTATMRPTVTRRSSTGPAAKMVIATTGFERRQDDQMRKFTAIFGCKMVKEVPQGATHLICVCDVKGNCPRTMKYLQAVVLGLFIIRYEWIEACVSRKEIINADPFEIVGSTKEPNSRVPQLARRNTENLLPPLFDACQFYFHGTFLRPKKEFLVQLVQMGGGKVLNREPKLDKQDDLVKMVPFHAERDSCCCFFVVHESVPDHVPNLELVRQVSSQWILDCIAHYKLLLS